MTRPSEKQNPATHTIQFRGRLVSLDAFRGITIAFMILLNNLGGEANYAILVHADWNGLTLADIFFPFFLFIVGASIAYSLGSKLEGNDDKRTLLPRIFRRTIILFALGFFINGFPYFNLTTLRVMGVLQRIALCYLAASAIYLTLEQKKRVITTAFLIVFYWLLMTVVPVPGYGAGVLTKDGNLAAYIDRQLLPSHLYAGTWDPEGFLSTIAALATTMLGLLTAEYLRYGGTHSKKLIILILSGVILIAMGAIWNLAFPINKNLWTSSFVLVTGGMAILIFCFCYYVVDFKKQTRWTKPFVIFGLNSIATYVLTEIMNLTLINTNITLADGTVPSIKSVVYQRLFASWAGPLNGSLAYALVFLMLWLGIMTILYKRRIFIII